MSTPNPRDELLEYLADMRGFARSLTRNRAKADDLMQDALLKAWKNIDRYKPGTNMKAWLFTIIRNTYYTQHQRAKREVADVDGAFSSKLSVKPDHDGRLHLKDFRTAFETLPVEQREALVLVGVQGFSYEEAAATAGVAMGTIKSRLNRARERLAEILELNGDGEMELTDTATVAVIQQDHSLVDR
ncbi:RNA polymerase sigma-70 factor, ECF subfamily [Cognatiyoonia koreensis]|uniref:RNA polymerase sigma-70 factor, ECF subfamily n=1 Tax=Cognatiyoonia koreensis TaxID=364200 RepID=A0A1I0PWZ0_9RHOB|nr:RNA polymerase sigma factor [Cognatiyoonia koreensis]SEW18996.1 RNA polymerase sigma-70 factor, ECF subfamily [Cognatiyoonia koreensis]